jgi:hypothetical protein
MKHLEDQVAVLPIIAENCRGKLKRFVSYTRQMLRIFYL